MAKFKFGEEGWGSDSDSFGESLFKRLDEGQNIVRIVSNPYKYWIHWIDDALGKHKKVKCSIENCPACVIAEKERIEIDASGTKKPPKSARKPRWIFAIIDRSKRDDNIKLVDVGPQIVRGIRGLADKPQLGDPAGYDIDITVNPNSKSDYYTVSAIPNGPDSRMKYPLEDSERVAVKAFLEKVDPEKLIIPDTPEYIRSVIGVQDNDSDEGKREEKSDVDNNFESGKNKKVLVF